MLHTSQQQQITFAKGIQQLFSRLIMSEQKRFTSRPKVVARKTPVVLGHFTSKETDQKVAHVCAICEEGGELIFCDGPCMRHFHENRVSRGAQTYSCSGSRGTLFRDDAWKCLDYSLGQAKCF